MFVLKENQKHSCTYLPTTVKNFMSFKLHFITLCYVDIIVCHKTIKTLLYNIML